jgi:hypothetical protein
LIAYLADVIPKRALPLARREERAILTEFDEVYARYAATTSSFLPRLRRKVRREAKMAEAIYTWPPPGRRGVA